VGGKTPTTITAVPIPPDQFVERDVTIAGHLTVAATQLWWRCLSFFTIRMIRHTRCARPPPPPTPLGAISSRSGQRRDHTRVHRARRGS